VDNPTLGSGATNFESEYREKINLQLQKIGDSYKIPNEDLWILSLDETCSIKQLKNKGIDLIMVSKAIQPFFLTSQLASKLLHHSVCAVHFLNS
jgi:hypothetical protein